MEQGGNDGSEVCVSFYGFVKTVEEAKGLFLLAREGKCHLVKKRLTQGQKNTIAPGIIFLPQFDQFFFFFLDFFFTTKVSKYTE